MVEKNALPFKKVPLPDWHATAECRGMPPEWWLYPESGKKKPGVKMNRDKAREICATCPHTSGEDFIGRCEASATNEDPMIFGGFSQNQRKERRQKNLRRVV